MSERIDRYANFDLDLTDGILTIRVNVNETQVDVQPSQSGKTMVVATTGGAVKIPHSPLKVNLTVYRSP